MKKTFIVSICLLLATLGGSNTQAQQSPSATRLAGSVPGPGRHLYLLDGRAHLVVQRTPGGTRVYRQTGTRLVPIR